MRRVLARRLCSQCGLDYNLIASSARRQPETCDVCQGDLVARADDNPEALAVRLADYHEETKPLIEIFERKEFVATIDATRPVDEVQAAIRERFELPATGIPPAAEAVLLDLSLIRSRVVRMPLRLVRPRAHPRTAQ